MQEVRRRRAVAIGLRARLPLVTRMLALFVLVAGVVFVAVSYYKLRNRTVFVMRPGAAELSKEETGRIEGYEQRITKSGHIYLWLRAAREITFADGHHELENVNLAVYSADANEKPDQITANRAIYAQKNSVISFLGNVNVETKDALKVNTESISYNQTTEIAQTDVAVSFTRENVSGRSVGALVESKNKKLELQKEVEITVAPEVLKDPQAKPSSTRSRPVTIHAAHALFEQNIMRLSFSGGGPLNKSRTS